MERLVEKRKGQLSSIEHSGKRTAIEFQLANRVIRMMVDNVSTEAHLLGVIQFTTARTVIGYETNGRLGGFSFGMRKEKIVLLQESKEKVHYIFIG